MGKQEGSPSGRCCAPWRQTSALHKAGGRASAPPGPSDLHLPEELLRHNNTNPHDCLEIILNILFYLSLLQVPCPELGLVCSRAFHCFCCFVERPRLCLLCAAVQARNFISPCLQCPLSTMGNRQPKHMHQWRNCAQVDCFLLVSCSPSTSSAKPSFRAAGPSFGCLNGCCVSLLARVNKTPRV